MFQWYKNASEPEEYPAKVSIPLNTRHVNPYKEIRAYIDVSLVNFVNNDMRNSV